MVDMKRFVASGVAPVEAIPTQERRCWANLVTAKGRPAGEALETPDDRSAVGNPSTAIPDRCCIEHSSSHAHRCLFCIFYLLDPVPGDLPAVFVRHPTSKATGSEKRIKRRQHRAPPLKELEAHVQQIRATILGPFWTISSDSRHPNQTRPQPLPEIATLPRSAALAFPSTTSIFHLWTTDDDEPAFAKGNSWS